MKKKLPPIFFVGAGINAVGVPLIVGSIATGAEHYHWIPISVLLLGTILIIVGVAKSKKEQ